MEMLEQIADAFVPVSYTHLDVYKSQECDELAWELDIDWYDSTGMSLEEKRETIKLAQQESDFLLNVPDNGIGGFDPAVELAFLGAYALLLHCPDGCALMDGGKKLHALTLIASVVDTNVKPLFSKLGVA